MLKGTYFFCRKSYKKSKKGKNVIFLLKTPDRCVIINDAFKRCCEINLFICEPKNEDFHSYAARKGESEHKMNYLAIDVAKQLIQLYYRSDKEYHCTLTKVEKLLAIAELVYARNNKRLFLEEITIKNCGVGIDGLEFDLPSEIIDTRSIEDRSETGETDTPVCPTYKPADCVPDYYRSNQNAILSEESRSLLLAVFEQFANYKARSIGTLIDGFKQYISTISDEPTQKRCIDQDKVREFFIREVDSSLKSNQVYNFIRNYKDL